MILTDSHLTRCRVGWLFVALNASLLGVIFLAILFKGPLKAWVFVMPWLALPAAFTFPSSIQVWLGFHIFAWIAGLMNQDATRALGIEAVLTTALVTCPVSYLVGIKLFDISRSRGLFRVILAYVALSVLSFLSLNTFNVFVEPGTRGMFDAIHDCFHGACPKADEWGAFL